MPEFCAYIVGRDGHFHDVVKLDCTDDEEAKAEARALVDGHAVELWHLARKIERFDRTK